AEGKARVDAGALALLVPLRGPLASLALLVLPTSAVTLAAAVLVSLLPVGAVLGRLLRPCVQAAAPWWLVGVGLGEALGALGAAGWLPAWLAGPLCAGLLLGLDWLVHRHEVHDEQAEPDVGAAVSLMLGASLALLLLVLQRVAASYATPSPHFTWDASLAL